MRLNNNSELSDRQQTLTTRCLAVYLAAIILITAIAWSVVLYRGKVQHRPYPFNSFLINPADRFADVMRYSYKVPLFFRTGFFDPAMGPSWIYPPASLFVLTSLYVTRHPLIAITAATGLIGLLGAFAIWLFCWIRGRSTWLVVAVITATLATSYPLLFSMDRGNMEPFVLLFVALGMIAFLSEKMRASAICFAIATCIKPFPMAFFFLFIRRRRYSEIAVAAGFAFIVNLIALYRMGPDFIQNYHGLIAGLNGFNNFAFSMDTSNAATFDHTLFSCIKQAMRLLTRTPPMAMGPLLQVARVPYLIGALTLGTACVFRIWTLPLINQVFALTIITILFPFVSFDYTLMQLYVPWALFFPLPSHRAP